jgi:hypothetical protein
MAWSKRTKRPSAGPFTSVGELYAARRAKGHYTRASGSSEEEEKAVLRRARYNTDTVMWLVTIIAAAGTLLISRGCSARACSDLVTLKLL